MSRVLSLLIFVSGLSAQVSEHRSRLGVPQDWTHRHVVFGHKLMAEHPLLTAVEPRLLHEFYRRAPVSLPSGTAPLVSDEQLAAMSAPGAQRDWNLFLGNGWVRIGMSPAKYSFDVNAAPSCTNDYVVFGLATSGVTGGQGNLVAVNNLYRGTGGLCGGLAAPTTLFSYNTTTVSGSEIKTSPVLSLDGTKIAFIESAGTSSIFHVLKWATGAGNGTSPTVSATPGVGNTATMTSLTYAAATDTRSSPWIDYTNDIAYVGADDGNLYKITGVFNGTPTLAGAPWPVLIGANRILTSPVLDQFTKNLFLGDSTGRLWSVSSVTPANKSNLAVGLANVANPAVIDGPILDSSNGTVFAVSSNDGTSAVVVQAGTTNLNELARARIGRGSQGGSVSVNLYDGAFDNNYFKGLPTGFLFVCGTGAADSTPWRYSFQFTGGIMNTLPSDSGQILNVALARCSPISEFFNPNIGAGGTDFFFWGVTTNCTGPATLGCVMSRTSPGGVVTTANEPSGTSTVIVDNVSTAGQASSIYFTDLGQGRRAVKLTQNGLQ
jgi:hypothetical protein